MSVSQSCQRSASYLLKRGRRGNVIVFMVAVSCTFLPAFLLFALSFTRLVGTNHEQKSGIDAAALAAAKDLSRIVVDDPNFGLIGLSDSAPIGPATVAQDGYYTQVHSINSILGTIRLDMIVASEVGDPIMMAFAQRDYANARLAADNLVAVLQASLLPSGGVATAAAAVGGASPFSNASAGAAGGGGGGASNPGAGGFVDAYGNQVFPYDDAVAAYESNQIRMAGQSEYVEGSMKLTLGSLLGGGPTNTPIPQPAAFANASGNLSYDGKYMSYVDVSFNSADFVFAGVGEAIKLVDSNKFVTADNSLPYTIPTIVKAEADQMFLEGHDIGGRMVHAVACAQPASTVDPLPAPGKLSISFPGPKIGRLGKPADLITDPEIGSPPAIISSPIGGDLPGSGSLAPVIWPIGAGGNPPIGNVFSGGIYDWLRRGGPKVRVDAMKSMMTQPFLNSATITSGLMQNYEFEADGTILQTLHVSTLTPGLQESQNQLHGTATVTDTSSSGVVSTYNVMVRNWVSQPGRIKGGKHSGEPLSDPLLDTTTLAQFHITGAALAQRLPAADGMEIAQGLELGAGGCGAGGPPGNGGSCGGGDNSGGTCGGGDNRGGTGGSCGGGDNNGGTGGSCGGGNTGSGSCGSGGPGVGAASINFSQGPGTGPGAVRDTYIHNGIDVDMQFNTTASGSTGNNSGSTSGTGASSAAAQ